MRLTSPPPPGLCDSCVHRRLVPGARSSFVRCALSDTDRRFPRYPSLPVLRCDGYSTLGRPAGDDSRPGS